MKPQIIMDALRELDAAFRQGQLNGLRNAAVLAENLAKANFTAKDVAEGLHVLIASIKTSTTPSHDT